MGLKTQFAMAATFGLAIVFGYEGYRVWQAREHTPGILAQLNNPSIRLTSLTDARRDMLLRVEDPGFYRHKGVDFSSPGQGATTLTQALVKRLYFENFSPGFAKIEQSLIARFVLDPALPKDRQLEAALNVAYLGHVNGKPVIGFDEAAAVYYNTSFDGLTDDQYLSLVAMLIAPNALDPIDHPAANEERTARIRNLLDGNCAPEDLRDVWYEGCAPTVLASN